MDELMEMLCDALKAKMAEGLENVDTHEAYEVVDMIKDLAEAQYYCTVVEAMHNGESIPYVSATAHKSMMGVGTV